MTFVNHATGSAIAVKQITPRHEVIIVNVVRGGGQTTDIYAGTAREINAIGVSEEYLTVGI